MPAPLQPGEGRGVNGDPSVYREGIRVREGDHSRATISLDLRKKEVMKFLLEKNNLKEISVLTGYSYQAVRNYVADPWFQNELRNYSEEVWKYVVHEIGEKQAAVAERVNLLSQQALDRMEKLIEHGSDNIAYKACQDILDRNPEVPRNRTVKAEVTNRIFNPADLMRAAATADELANYSAPKSATVIEAKGDPNG